MLNIKTVISLISCLILGYSSEAQIKLPNIFSNGMVLQQDASNAIWGKAIPGNKIEVLVSWSKNSYSTKVKKDSSWVVKIPTRKASYKKNTIRIIAVNDTIILNNVLIGEVWLCSGQSNMEMRMKGNRSQAVEGSLEAIISSKNEYIRSFHIKKRSAIYVENEVEGDWQISSPTTTGGFSAVGYFFAKKLQSTLDVPVAFIVSSWGASSIEAWMSQKALSTFENIELPKSEKDNKIKMQTPTVLFNGMINGIVGYGIKGILWYQGETNRDNYKQYPSLFKKMHQDWVNRWSIGSLPIYFAQIAPFDYWGSTQNSSFFREAQSKIDRFQKNTAMIVLSDVGDSLCIHPSQKKEVGNRFAYMAMGKSYGMGFLDYRSTRYKNIKIEGDKVKVYFDSPLGVTFNDNERTGFEISGTDKKFYPAKVQFEVHTEKVITLTSDKVPHPVAVRYQWRNYFKATLFGPNGLPVSSFRSDDWEK